MFFYPFKFTVSYHLIDWFLYDENTDLQWVHRVTF